MSLLEKVNIRDTVRFTENDAIPIYRQIAESLRQSILSGEFKEGCKLPSESEFAKELGINHLTLRKSLQILSEQKLITQRQGKGTFVNPGCGYEKRRRYMLLLNAGSESSFSRRITSMTSIFFSCW